VEHWRWLLAYLIDWHKREENADWWDYFRLLELDEADLLDEPRALTGLVYAGAVEVVLNRRTGRPTGSTIHRYSYPPQDVEIGRKGSLTLQSGEHFGTIVAHDRDERISTSRRRRRHPATLYSTT
jgi:uncharacterized protein